MKIPLAELCVFDKDCGHWCYYREVINLFSGDVQIVPAQQNLRFDWDDYRIFAAVARTGSHRRAAKELCITAPAVGRRIAGLEAKLGVRLLTRTTQGVELTSEGHRVLSYANVAESALLRAADIIWTASLAQHSAFGISRIL